MKSTSRSFYLSGPCGGCMTTESESDMHSFDDSDSKHVGGTDPAPLPVLEISVRHGAVINGLSMVWLNSLGCQVASNLHGGSEGERSTWTLPEGEDIHEVTGTWGWTKEHGVCVTSLQFVGTKGTKSDLFGTPDKIKANKFFYSSPEGSRIGAFFGISGKVLYSLGACYTNTPLHRNQSAIAA